MTFVSKLNLNIFSSLKTCALITRSCLHNINSLFYCNMIEATPPVFKSSCPILLFQNEMAHAGYWIRIFIASSFHPWPQFRSAVQSLWALASKLSFKYYNSYIKRLGHGLILRNSGQASELLFQFFFPASPKGWIILLDACLGVRSFYSTLLSIF